MKGAIELSKVVEELRAELIAAAEEGEEEELRFAVEAVEIELQVAVTREAEAGAKAKFWVLEAGAKGKLADSRTQRVTLKLAPRRAGEGDGTSEVLIGGQRGQVE